jgi:hypothetical protein
LAETLAPLLLGIDLCDMRCVAVSLTHTHTQFARRAKFLSTVLEND